MDKARAFMVDDRLIIMESASRLLEEAGHTVPFQISTFDEALRMVDHVERMKINLAILARSLDHQKRDDGAEIAQALKRKLLRIKIIAFCYRGVADDPEGDFKVEWADVTVRKPLPGVLGIVAAVNRL